MGILRAKQPWIELFCGMEPRHFNHLIDSLRDYGVDTGRGRPWRLELEDRVLLVAIYYRTNVTMRQMANWFGISAATVCRIVAHLGPYFSLEQSCQDSLIQERVWDVDGEFIASSECPLGVNFQHHSLVSLDHNTRLVVSKDHTVLREKVATREGENVAR
ncbi:helix-turn-helix domain-containing protein [Streptomyces lavendulocolor]|uniref:helix-turn-helix domain-containing protein n=1 Tax=Streptomyces lavendulocolor TaxID=67316 RepID=UPI0033C684CE